MNLWAGNKEIRFFKIWRIENIMRKNSFINIKDALSQKKIWFWKEKKDIDQAMIEKMQNL